MSKYFKAHVSAKKHRNNLIEAKSKELSKKAAEDEKIKTIEKNDPKKAAQLRDGMVRSELADYGLVVIDELKRKFGGGPEELYRQYNGQYESYCEEGCAYQSRSATEKDHCLSSQ